jgi:hypothetical protein
VKKAIVAAAVLAVLVTAFHDAGRYVELRRQLVEGTRLAAEHAATLRTDRNTAARAAMEMAEIYDITVIAYDQDASSVEVWGQIEIEGTWVLADINALVEGRDRDLPYVIRHAESARIR